MSIIDLFFPTQIKCIFCGKETSEFGICEECYSKLPFIEGKTCKICGTEIKGRSSTCIECKDREYSFDTNHAILHYIGEVQQKIIAFKQGGKKYYGEDFALLIERKYNELLEEIDIIVPVPINDNRLKERGFNQSEILCKDLPEDKVNKNILKRVKDTPHQTGLSRDNRQENLLDGFEVIDKDVIKNKTILIVDDIYTTGSTLNECAKILKNNGAKSIIGLTLARTPVKADKVLTK